MGKNQGELDKTDKQLMYWIDLDCRESHASLAKKMRTSAAKVSYRLAQLIKNRAINSFVTLIDYRKLGYRGYAAYFKLKEMSKEELREIVKKIEGIPNIADILLTSGTYDLQLVFLVTSSDEAAEGLWSVRGILEKYILEERLVVNLKTQFFSRTHFLDEDAKKEVKPRLVLDAHEVKTEVDEIDDKILSSMAEHADWPLWKIADATGVAGPTVYNRIKRLEKNKIIVGYTAKMNPNLRGHYLYRVLAKLRYMPREKREEFMRFLDQHPAIYRSSFTFGGFDLMYDARVVDDGQLRELLRQVYGHFKDEVIRQDWVRVHEIIRFSFYIHSKK